jgi:hypothetical protein
MAAYQARTAATRPMPKRWQAGDPLPDARDDDRGVRCPAGELPEQDRPGHHLSGPALEGSALADGVPPELDLACLPAAHELMRGERNPDRSQEQQAESGDGPLRHPTHEQQDDAGAHGDMGDQVQPPGPHGLLEPVDRLDRERAPARLR